MTFSDFLKVKKNIKICSKTYQIAPLKFFLGVSMPPNLPSKRRGRQLIVCSALYVYALQNLSRGQ